MNSKLKVACNVNKTHAKLHSLCYEKVYPKKVKKTNQSHAKCKYLGDKLLNH